MKIIGKQYFRVFFWKSEEVNIWMRFFSVNTKCQSVPCTKVREKPHYKAILYTNLPEFPQKTVLRTGDRMVMYHSFIKYVKTRKLKMKWSEKDLPKQRKQKNRQRSCLLYSESMEKKFTKDEMF